MMIETVTGVPGMDVEEGSTDSNEAWSCALAWLHQCLNSHSLCNNSISNDHDDWFPTRLLDLTPPDGTVRLIETEKTTPRGAYITLSHCWGTKGNVLKMAQSTLEDFKRKLPDNIPKTFQHAIAAARKLGVEYLWIDSLCIIQDDATRKHEVEASSLHRADWQRKSSLMHKVY
jgi:hypothetical protein